MLIERSRNLSARIGLRSFVTGQTPLPSGIGAPAAAGMRWLPRAQSVRREGRIYGRVGDLEVRMATAVRDIRRAQRLRYQVFYDEMSATPSLLAELRRRDEDPYDSICDHLLVVDRAAAPSSLWTSGRSAHVVGTYRLLRQDIAERHFGFYTQGEYDIAPLLKRYAGTHRFLELGRSCVLKPYRNRRTVELLWHGLWTYAREHKVDVMIGCASFAGTDPSAHAMALSFLHHNALAPEPWRCTAHPQLYQRMDLMPKEAIDAKAALKVLPPLIKGYLRLGAFIGDGAVIDHQFGTTDVLIVLPVSNIDPRYFDHFGAPDEIRSRIASDV
ncbi:MAG: GNAT family N-acetyltransferase [Hyphomicrobiaceae bacterium]|nr:GNAT family N-acetyltransferase [Hyphomicrobiaceae bacterium]MCC0007231.1 GNAT family N-acetyltransferase [Hyphomicrobiaceae bacterium]